MDALIPQGVHPADPAGDRVCRVAALGQPLRGRLAYSRGCAGDERDATGRDLCRRCHALCGRSRTPKPVTASFSSTKPGAVSAETLAALSSSSSARTAAYVSGPWRRAWLSVTALAQTFSRDSRRTAASRAG